MDSIKQVQSLSTRRIETHIQWSQFNGCLQMCQKEEEISVRDHGIRRYVGAGGEGGKEGPF